MALARQDVKVTLSISQFFVGYTAFCEMSVKSEVINLILNYFLLILTFEHHLPVNDDLI